MLLWFFSRPAGSALVLTGEVFAEPGSFFFYDDCRASAAEKLRERNT